MLHFSNTLVICSFLLLLIFLVLLTERSILVTLHEGANIICQLCYNEIQVTIVHNWSHLLISCGAMSMCIVKELRQLLVSATVSHCCQKLNIYLGS